MSSQNDINKYCVPFDVSVPECAESLLIPTNDSNTAIVVHFVDKFRNVWKYEGFTDPDGVIEVPVNTFSAGLFNSYAGAFVVYITYQNLPARWRVWIRSDFGYYPSLVLEFYRTNLLSNTQVPVELSRFVCCCYDNTSCGNLQIDPCDFSLDTPPCLPGLVDGSVFWRSAITNEILENDTEDNILVDHATHTHEVILELNALYPGCCGLGCNINFLGYTVLEGLITFNNVIPGTLECESSTLIEIFAQEFDNRVRFDFSIETDNCEPYLFSKELRILVQ